MELRLITDVFLLPHDAMYGEGEPVFDDPVKDPFLSPKYSLRVKRTLESYGLQYFTTRDFLALLEADLRSSNSRMHGTKMTDGWHSAVADLLCSWFDREYSQADRLKLLPLIPLRDGEWTSAALNPVYFPNTERFNIPENLDIRVLQSTATSNISRKKLFGYLGVSNADDVTVRASILRAYTSKKVIYLKDNLAYFRYLYLTHTHGLSTKTELEKIVVVDGQRNRFRPHETDVYLPGRTHIFSPESLLAPTEAAPGLSVAFIHSSYMSNIPKKPSQAHLSWEMWLFNFVGIREQLRLVNHNREALSEAAMYVHEHRPERFLGLLRYLWRDMRPEVKGNQILRRVIKALSAKDLCRVNHAISLGDTWLPLENLRGKVSLYMEFPKHFPFLKIDSTGPADEFSVQWSFLTNCFGVKKEENFFFYMEMLYYIQKSHADAETVSVLQSQKIFDLYAAIYGLLTVAGNQPEDQRIVK